VPLECAVASLASLARGEQNVASKAEGATAVVIGFIVAKPFSYVHMRGNRAATPRPHW
jgi:hypothetical protein